ncbi:unnamed protein product [Linum trigynum]|uniref:Reverse transcriptase domain-containing protein n=1 Tax=Linum trigynum TaxID=586398 RepID=A0AAV2CV78_9ROSI
MGLRTVKSIPPKCRLGFARTLKGALDDVGVSPGDLSCWIRLLVLSLCVLKTFYPRSNLECRSADRRLRQEESVTSAIIVWGSGGSLQLLRVTLDEVPPPFSVEEELVSGELNLWQCRRKICDGHYTAVVRVLSSSDVAPYSDATLLALQDKHLVAPPPSLPTSPVDHHPLVVSSAVVLDMIRSFPRGTSCGRDGFRAQHLMDCLGGADVAISDDLLASITRVVNLFIEGRCLQPLGEYIASAPLTSLVKPGGGICPIVVGTVWRRLVSKVGACLVGPTLSGYFAGLQFGVGVSGGGEAILACLEPVRRGPRW